MVPELKDPRLLAKVKKLIRAEHAGFIAEGDRCGEPGCSCNFGICGPFRDTPVRCTSFEALILPLTSDKQYDSQIYTKYAGLEEAYWKHLSAGAVLTISKCRHLLERLSLEIALDQPH